MEESVEHERARKRWEYVCTASTAAAPAVATAPATAAVATGAPAAVHNGHRRGSGLRPAERFSRFVMVFVLNTQRPFPDPHVEAQILTLSRKARRFRFPHLPIADRQTGSGRVSGVSSAGLGGVRQKLTINL